MPAPYAPPIEDAEVVKKSYNYWRWRIFYSMSIGFAFFYFTRKSFTFAKPGLIEDMGMSMGDLGLLESISYHLRRQQVHQRHPLGQV